MTRNEQPTLIEALRRSPWIAIDTEADSLHSYPEKLCLVQLSHAGGDELVDPLCPESLTPLLDELSTRELTMHGASFDLRLLRRTYGFVAKQIFDTEIAARLVGRPHSGLRDLVSEILGVELEKGSQQANWSQRPLTPKMVEYAHGDTRHLKPLRDFLDGELTRLGRQSWHRETCARLVARSVPVAPDPSRDWRIRGSARLGSRALAILRELWLWREEEAIARNRPPYFVLSHETLVRIALQAERKAVALPPEVKAAQQSGVEEAVVRARALPEAALPKQELPEQPLELTGRARDMFNAVRTRRDRRAAELGLEPTLIATKADLIALAEDFDAAIGAMMAWQAALLQP
jgi:ribonuclease D